MKYLKILTFILSISVTLQLSAQKEDREAQITESSEPMEDIFIDDIVKRTLVEEGRFLEYAPIREADIAWEKRIWRVIDTREKMNLYFRYENGPFFTILREMATNGDITLFKEEDFSAAYTLEEVEKLVNKIDTISTFDYDTYEEKIEVVRNEINWEDINQYRVKEMWYFDEQESKLKVRILGIAPMYTESSEELETGFTRPLFWVYYPEARESLSKQRVFNDNNDIAPRSWYDVFEDRSFASFITKKSNSLDLRIKDIYDGYERAGIDRLLESEKIKAELFNFEHDLWEY